MLKTVKLYGDLADFVGWKEQKAEVKNPVEVMKFLICNHPKLESYMVGKYYRIDMGEYDASEDDLLNPIKDEIKIIPITEGAFFGKLFKAIAGVALIAFATPIAGFLALEAVTVTTLGAGLLFQSAAEYLTPKPKPMSSLEPEDPTVNFAFSGITNVSRAGVALPLVYGEIFVGSINVSNGIDTDQIEVSV